MRAELDSHDVPSPTSSTLGTLLTRLAPLALAARIALSANTDHIANLDIGDLRTSLDDLADDFMTANAGRVDWPKVAMERSGITAA